MTLLSICRDASDEIGIPQPASVAGNTDPIAQKLLRYANKVGNSLMKAVPWQSLRKEQTFTAIAGETQTGIIPADFDRFVPETFWDRSATALLSGPISSTEWGGLKASSYSGSIRKFIYRGGIVAVVPVFAGGESLAFEYVSAKWVLATDAVTYKAAFSADTDTSLIDEELLTLGVAWEYLNGEGLPSQRVELAYRDRLKMMIDNDQPTAGVMIAADIFGSATRHFDGTPTNNAAV
jgi:hypothetical protein